MKEQKNGLYYALRAREEVAIGNETVWSQASELIKSTTRQEYGKLFGPNGDKRQTEEGGKDQRVDVILRILGVLPGEGRFLDGSFLAEGLQLRATRRLFGLAQVSPVVNNLLGLDLTRGRHTADCMRLTAQVLVRAAVDNPMLFDQLSEGYEVELTEDEFPEIGDRVLARRVKIIQHGVEYMRRHDELTLAFQGAMHGRVRLFGRGYDEDEAFLKLIATANQEDLETELFYKKHNLQRSIVIQIAREAILGSSGLAQVLKGKGDTGRILSIDWLAYTSRDMSELTGFFVSESSLPTREKLEQVARGLIALSGSLAGSKQLVLKGRIGNPGTEELIALGCIRLENHQGRPAFVFDALTAYHLYTSHLLLRLYFSGSPLVRGTHHLVEMAYRDIFGKAEKRLVGHLMSTTEERALRCELAERMPILSLNQTSLLHPEILPAQIKGWFYSSEPGRYPPESFVFKDILDTLVWLDGQILPIGDAFPDLMGVGKTIEEHIQSSPLYLRQRNR